jgi:GrpB-like predicted nucleotidyltransferase (UPF0157 family)
MQKIIFRKYNPKYPKFFFNEKKLLKTVLTNNVEIIHIGSTSILNLDGKAVIDIMVVNINNNLKGIKNKLLSLDYNYHLELSFGDREFFSKEKEKNNDNIRIHLHLTYKGSTDHKKALRFKKYLSNNKKSALDYQNLKKRAIKEANGDYKKYRQIKNIYIKDIFKSM